MEKKFKTSFYYSLDQKKDQKHNKVIFFFKNKQKLIYNDVRKFGFIKFFNASELEGNQHFKILGPEPLSKYWNTKYFKKYITGRDRSIKNILMDQKFVCGLGNIYVNEILFFSRVNPVRKVSNLKDIEIQKIVKNKKKILRNSIKLGGSSIKDFSTDDGKKGIFQQYFRVYGRKGEKCSNIDCNKKILRANISNRSTFFVKDVKNNKVDPIKPSIYTILKMPNTKSAIRRVRRVKKQAQVNRIEKVNIKTQSKKWN